jgi:hypothetical protein
MNGGTVIRPLFFEFPDDAETFDLGYEFMWGPSILVMPVTDPGVTTVDGYLPGDTEWYYLYSTSYGTQEATGHGTFDAPKNSSAPAFLRGGSIVPRQAPAMTTTDTRNNHFQLVIACSKSNYLFKINPFLFQISKCNQPTMLRENFTGMTEKPGSIWSPIFRPLITIILPTTSRTRLLWLSLTSTWSENRL